MVSCLDVANYFLAKQDDESGEIISNLQLQKLLYYAQAYYLAINDEPLFLQTIEIWMHGHVIPELHHNFGEYGSERIPPPKNYDFSALNYETKKLLDDIYCMWPFLNAEFRNITHNELPDEC